MSVKLVINNSKKIPLVDELYDEKSKYIKVNSSFLELTQKKELLTKTPPYIKVKSLKDQTEYFVREIFDKTIKFVFNDELCAYDQEIIEVKESEIRSDRFNEIYQNLFTNMGIVNESYDYHYLWILESGEIFDEDYVSKYQFRNNEEIKLKPLYYKLDEYDTTNIPLAEECDYYFETLEDYRSRIDSILLENNYYLHNKTFGFGASVKSLVIMDSGAMGPVIPTTAKSLPKMLVSDVVTSIQHLGGNPKKLRVIPSTLFKGLTKLEAIIKGRVFNEFSSIKNHIKELPKIKIPNKLLYNSTLVYLQEVFEYLNITLPDTLFNPVNNIVSISRICYNVYSIEAIKSSVWNVLSNISDASYAFACESSTLNGQSESAEMSLVSVDEDLFDGTRISNVSGIFKGQKNIKSNVPDFWTYSSVRSYTGAYKDCINALNYSEIPEGYK